MSRRSSRRSRWGSTCQNPSASYYSSGYAPPMYHHRPEPFDPGAYRPPVSRHEPYHPSPSDYDPEPYGFNFTPPQEPISFFNAQVAPPTRFPNIEMAAATSAYPRSHFPNPEYPSTSSSETYNLTVQVDRNSTRRVDVPRTMEVVRDVHVPIEARRPEESRVVNAQRVSQRQEEAVRALVEMKREEDGSKEAPIQLDDSEERCVKSECIEDLENHVAVDVKTENGEVPVRVLKSEYCRCCGTPRRLTVMLSCHPKKEAEAKEIDLHGTADDPIVIDDDPEDDEIPAQVEDTPESPPPEVEAVEEPVRIPLTPMRCPSPDQLQQALWQMHRQQEEVWGSAYSNLGPPGDPSSESSLIDADDDGMLPDSDNDPYFTESSDSDSEQPQPSSSSSYTDQPSIPKPSSSYQVINMSVLAAIVKRRLLDINNSMSPGTIYASVTADESFDEVMQALHLEQTKIIITVKRRKNSEVVEVPERTPPPNDAIEVAVKKPSSKKRSRQSRSPDNKSKKKRITGPFELKPTKTKCYSASRRNSLASEDEPQPSEVCPEPSPDSGRPDSPSPESRSLSPASEARALALATLRRPAVSTPPIVPSSPTPEPVPSTMEDIPLPPKEPEPQEPVQEEEILPPPPPPPELDDHDMDNSAVVDMDVEVEVDDEQPAKQAPLENAHHIPTIGSRTTNHINLLTRQLRGNNISIPLEPPPPPPKSSETSQLEEDIKATTKRRILTGNVHEDDLPPNCPRPQQALGRTFPTKVRVVVEDDGEHSDSNNHNQENYYRPKIDGLRKVASESQMAEKGRAPPPKCFGNRTMRVINGKRVFSDQNTCYEYAEKGVCTAGIFCRFGHGEEDTTEKKICAKMLRGQCRGDRGCQLHHNLPPHQMPICDFYLRHSCNSDKCCFVHVRHSEDKAPCDEFNRGTCQSGDSCPKPHRYIYRTVKLRGEFPPSATDGAPLER
ncbi:hypothetical protein QR680_015412 [Steinernema hermaphroditum]|uniref:C3H1-type domain-containing protein n=1 Tax=Steinernema hermaphroditum TaxID=289476 RepID=A0AA39H7U9_9BILA|nr:hypothetical protein QR680_015412 [Steinernema hermaphroditum]